MSIKSRVNHDVVYNTQTLVIDDVTSYSPHCFAEVSSWISSTGLFLAGPEFLVHRPTEILLGIDICQYIIQSGSVHHPSGTPVGQKNSLVWIFTCSSNVHVEKSKTVTQQYVLSESRVSTENASLVSSVNRFWDVESDCECE